MDDASMRRVLTAERTAEVWTRDVWPPEGCKADAWSGEAAQPERSWTEPGQIGPGQSGARWSVIAGGPGLSHDSTAVASGPVRHGPVGANAISVQARQGVRDVRPEMRPETRMDRGDPVATLALGPHHIGSPGALRPAAGGHLVGDAVKTVFDRSAALAGVVLLMPLFVMVALLIWLRDPGLVLYGHLRIGKGGRKFRCLKFRTMVRDGDRVLAAHLAADPEAAREWEATRKLRADPRVTPLGRVLRKTSLDELPQLFNVLKGDMSLVGPRPIVADEARHYGAAIRDYLSVRPGLTGLWQIGGRSDTSYAERVRLDQTYVQRRSLTLDVTVLLRTVLVVLRGRGSY